MIVACFLCAVGCSLTLLNTSVFVLAIGRFLIGVGSSFGFLSCVKSASLFFSREYVPIFIGVSITIGSLGVISGYPLVLLINSCGWYQTTVIFAILSFLFALSIFFTVPGYQCDSERGTSLKSDESLYDTFQIILKNPKTWLYGFYGLLIYTPLSGFADLWGVTYFIHRFNVEKETAILAVSFCYIGVACGALAWPLLLKRVKSYRLIQLTGVIASVGVFWILLYFSSLAFFYTHVLCFVLGFTLASQIVVFGAIMHIPVQIDRRFQFNSIADSSPNRSVIPILSDH